MNRLGSTIGRCLTTSPPSRTCAYGFSTPANFHTQTCLRQYSRTTRYALETGPPAALAYMLLRLTWESVERWSPLVEVDVRQFIESSYVQRCWNVVYDPRTTRALTFATFAGLYWMIKQASGPTVPRYRADDRITTAYLGMAGEQLFGAVWFPTIPGVLEQEAADSSYLDLAKLRAVTMRAVVEQKPLYIPT